VEAVKTNVLGTENVLTAAIEAGVKDVICLSTDKAAYPVNAMGTSKAMMEKVVVAKSRTISPEKTKICCTRYGNVLCSRGSVIPFFKQLLEQGEKELPITDLRMTRFWMVLDDAVNLVLKALKESKGGETFVFKNPSFLITELAKALNPNGTIREIGIREGEKIHEVMITRDDANYTYDYGDHYIIYPNFEWWSKEKIKLGGILIPKDWDYNSGTNDIWLEADELRKRIANLNIKD